MIVALLGKAGAGKTTIAKAMSKYVEGSIVIDGDELREATRTLALRTQVEKLTLGWATPEPRLYQT